MAADSRRPLNLGGSQTGEVDAKDHDHDQDKGRDRDDDHSGNHNTMDTIDASHYEQTHVHEVYDAIADHFSATRYAPWPLVAQFLAAQPPGSIGLDVGCGNGKYLSGASGAPLSSTLSEEERKYPQLFILGSDRSPALARFAYEKHAQHQLGADVLLADSLALPFRDCCADFVICIAVVHHLSTPARRQAAVKELLRSVRPFPSKQNQNQPPANSSQTPPAPTAATTAPAPAAAASTPASSLSSPTTSSPSPLLSGRVLLYVWALEQASSRRGWAAGGEQDLLVPWVKTMRDTKKNKSKHKSNDKDTNKGKKRDKKRVAGGIDNNGEGKTEEQDTKATDAQDAQELPAQDQEPQQKQPHVPPTFHRYYHLYKQGELEADVAAAGGRVVASGYEKDNWWVVADPL